jgi:hypothetical protein
MANAWLWSNIPIAVPIVKVIANPISNVTYLGYDAIALMILSFNDIAPFYKNEIFKDVVSGFRLCSFNA